MCYRSLSIKIKHLVWPSDANGRTVYVQSQVSLSEEIKKEIVETEDADQESVSLESTDDVLVPSTVVVSDLKKFVLFELPSFTAQITSERFDHNSKALTTFFVKLFNHELGCSILKKSYIKCAILRVIIGAERVEFMHFLKMVRSQLYGF